MSGCQGLLLSPGKVEVWTQFQGYVIDTSIKKERKKDVRFQMRAGLEGRPYSGESDAQGCANSCRGGRYNPRIGLLGVVGTTQGHITYYRVSPTFRQVYTGCGLRLYHTIGSIAIQPP